MRITLRPAILTIGCLFAPLTNTAWGLGVGDPAPKLAIAEWVKGEAFDLQKELGKRLVLVEFWAVWCGPCKQSVPMLSRIQAKYRDNLTIVGVTTPDAMGNSPSAIRKFATDMGSSMSYHVAIDDRDQTQNAYMVAAGAMGIPHAFLVGKDGKVVWQGSPLDPAMETVIAGMVAGTYDAKMEIEIDRRLRMLEEPLGRGQWTAVVDGLKEILKLAPAHEVSLRALRRAYTEEMQKPEEYRAWVQQFMDANRSNNMAMVLLTGVLTEGEDLAARYPDLAVQAGKAAYESVKSKNFDVVALYAVALYQAGAIDRAIAVQKEAVDLAQGDDKKYAQATLDALMVCKKVVNSE